MIPYIFLYGICMDVADRVRKGCSALGISQAELARRVGIEPTQLLDIFRSKTGRSKHLPKIAEVLDVPVVWLTSGLGAAPPWAPVELGIFEEPFAVAAANPGTPVYVSEGEEGEVSVLGTVSAGDGQVPATWSPANGASFRLPTSWVAVEITGNSAYPVAYPGQLALVDLERAVSPRSLDAATLHDLNDNLCLIQTREDGQLRAYLKRFCADRRAPAGFILASVDSGRGSPYLPAEMIDLIAPVVAVVFEDPRKPRVKGRNRAVVKIPTPGGEA